MGEVRDLEVRVVLHRRRVRDGGRRTGGVAAIAGRIHCGGDGEQSWRRDDLLKYASPMC